MKIYFNVDRSGYLTSWGNTRTSNDAIEFHINKNHEALTNPEIFKYVGGELIKDEEKQQQLIEEYEKEERKPSATKRNELAIIELAGMLSMMTPSISVVNKISFSLNNEGGDNVIALLYATNIIEGWIEFKDVGHLWVEDVKKILRAEGREDLIK